MDELFRAIEGNRAGSLSDILRMTDFSEPLFDLLNRPSPEHACTPLVFALKRPGIEPAVVQLLLEAGSSTEGDPFGALHYALAAHQPLPVIKLLLDFKADIYATAPLDSAAEEKDPAGKEYSLLHYALLVGASEEIIALLGREGGWLLINNQQNLDHETPLSNCGNVLAVLFLFSVCYKERVKGSIEAD